jgi:hypothetical protein
MTPVTGLRKDPDSSIERRHAESRHGTCHGRRDTQDITGDVPHEAGLTPFSPASHVQSSVVPSFDVEATAHMLAMRPISDLAARSIV